MGKLSTFVARKPCTYLRVAELLKFQFIIIEEPSGREVTHGHIADVFNLI